MVYTIFALAAIFGLAGIVFFGLVADAYLPQGRSESSQQQEKSPALIFQLPSSLIFM